MDTLSDDDIYSSERESVVGDHHNHTTDGYFQDASPSSDSIERSEDTEGTIIGGAVGPSNSVPHVPNVLVNDPNVGGVHAKALQQRREQLAEAANGELAPVSTGDDTLPINETALLSEQSAQSRSWSSRTRTQARGDGHVLDHLNYLAATQPEAPRRPTRSMTVPIPSEAPPAYSYSQARYYGTLDTTRPPQHPVPELDDIESQVPDEADHLLPSWRNTTTPSQTRISFGTFWNKFLKSKIAMRILKECLIASIYFTIAFLICASLTGLWHRKQVLFSSYLRYASTVANLDSLLHMSILKQFKPPMILIAASGFGSPAASAGTHLSRSIQSRTRYILPID